jgi:mRNA interferase RelE/StbE
LKRIVFSDDAKSNIRAIPRQTAMSILAALHRFAESGAGDVKMLKGNEADKRLRVGDFRVRFTETESEIHIEAIKNRKNAYR